LSTGWSLPGRLAGFRDTIREVIRLLPTRVVQEFFFPPSVENLPIIMLSAIARRELFYDDAAQLFLSPQPLSRFSFLLSCFGKAAAR